jgi:hypothetical protein
MTKLLFMLFVGLIGFKPTLIVKYNNTKKNTAYIDYNKTQKLKWTDFKIYNGKRVEAALTATQISYTINIIDDVMHVDVSCVFDKNKSSVVAANKNDYILNHEQRHFDISYLFAMKFVHRLQNDPNLKADKISAIYDDIYADWIAYQNTYDVETNNSRSKENQALWDKKINHELEDL